MADQDKDSQAGPTCNGADGSTGGRCGRIRQQIGSSWYCPNVACQMYCVPTDAEGKRKFTGNRGTCTRCNGSGSVKVMQGDGEYLESCEDCMGSGVELTRKDLLLAGAA